MIAPLRESVQPEPPKGLEQARRYVANVFLTETADRLPSAPVPAWKASLWAAWAIVAASAYAAHWAGWI